jgi:glycerol-1-phosphate dehydrogenase [NAD(P)+]
VPIREIVVEEHALSNIDQIVDRLGLGKKCLIVEDRTTRNIAGDQVAKRLKGAAYSISETTVERADLNSVNEVAGLLRGFDFSIAVGGGTPIDVAKLATYRNRSAFISIPTALSHDGIASPIASIAKNRAKTSVLAHPPVAVIADPKILAQAPSRMIAAGYGDLVSKATSVKDWELGRDERDEYYCEEAATLAFQAMADIVEAESTPSSKAKVKNLLEALLNCGVSMILAGSSRPCSGAEHLFSHYLDANAESPAMHGQQCGIGAILMAKYHEEHNPHWWKNPTLQWQRIKQVLKRVEPSFSLQAIGVSENVAAAALTEAPRLRPERYTILHKRPLSRNEAKVLLESTSVIRSE